MNIRAAALAILLTTLAAAPAFAAEQAKPDAKTQAAIDQVAAKAAKVKSFSADFSTIVGGAVAGFHGHITFMLPDKIRKSTLGDIELTLISDGKTRWLLLPARKQNRRTDLVKLKKARDELGLPMEPEDRNLARPFDLMKHGSAKLTGTEKVGRTECWVFEGAPNAAILVPAPARNLKKVRICVAKSDGLARRMTFIDWVDDSMMETTYDNVKVNPDVKPELFRYTPPKGAAVMDRTQQLIMKMKQTVPKKK